MFRLLNNSNRRETNTKLVAPWKWFQMRLGQLKTRRSAFSAKLRESKRRGENNDAANRSWYKQKVRCIMFTLIKSVSRKGWRSAMILGQLLWSQTRPTVWLNFRLRPYHEMERKIPNRSVDKTPGNFLFSLLAAKKKPMLRPSVKAIARRHGEVFLARDWLCIGATFLLRCFVCLCLRVSAFAPRQILNR